ncbi:unnamed protein product [Closterium sp. Naga37s-1]|nr:unnamed protein product [Closterium sp. Naga37s-1]
MSMSMEALQMAMADDVDQWDAADDPQGTLSMMAMLLGGGDASLGGTNDVFLGGSDFHLGGASDMLLGGTTLEDLLSGGTHGGTHGGNGGGIGGRNGGDMVHGQGLGGPAMGSDNRIASVATHGHLDGALLEAAYNGTQPVGYDYHASAHATHNDGFLPASTHGASGGQWDEQVRDASIAAHSSAFGLDSSAVLGTNSLVGTHAHSAIAPDPTNLYMLQQQQQHQQQQHLLLHSEPHAQAWPDLKPPAELKPERRALVVQSCDYKGGKGGNQGARLLQMPPGLRLAPPVVPALAAAATTTNAAALGNALDSAASAAAGSNVNASARMLLPRASTAPANAAPLGSAATAEVAVGNEPFPDNASGAMACGMWRSHSSSSQSRPVAVWASKGGGAGVSAVAEVGEVPATGLLHGPGEGQGLEGVATAFGSPAAAAGGAAAAAAAGSGGESAARAGMRKSRSSSSARPRVTQLGARGGSKRATAAATGTGMSRSRSSHVLLTTPADASTPAASSPAPAAPAPPSHSPPLPAAAAAAAVPSIGGVLNTGEAGPGSPESDLPAFQRENQALALALLRDADLCFSPPSQTAASAGGAVGGAATGTAAAVGVVDPAACSYDVSGSMSGGGAAGAGMSSCSLGGTTSMGGGSSMGGAATGGDSSDPEDRGLAKGTWLPEEDGVLMEYVRCHGPRNWGALRARGLLRRSGKSCRLRWVNQLKPGLQRYGGKGCKRFSEAEASVVLALQRAVGNKWAHIARHLPGRTDNDVKNFWNLHLKRQARLRARGGGARLGGDGDEGERDGGDQDNQAGGNHTVGNQSGGDRKGDKQAAGDGGDGGDRGSDSSTSSGSPRGEAGMAASEGGAPGDYKPNDIAGTHDMTCVTVRPLPPALPAPATTAPGAAAGAATHASATGADAAAISNEENGSKNANKDTTTNAPTPAATEAGPAPAPALPVPSSLPPHMHQHAKPLLPRARPSSSSGRPLSAGSRPSSSSGRQSKLSLHQRRLQRNSSGGGGSGLGSTGGGGGGGCSRNGNGNGVDSMTGTAAAAAGATGSGDEERAAGGTREAGGEAGEEAMDVAGAGSSLSALKIGEPNAQLNTLINLEDWINSPSPVAAPPRRTACSPFPTHTPSLPLPCPSLSAAGEPNAQLNTLINLEDWINPPSPVPNAQLITLINLEDWINSPSPAAAAPPRRTGCSPFYINLSPSARRLRSPGSPSPRSLYLRSPSPRALASPRALPSPRHRASPAHRVFPHPPPHPSRAIPSLLLVSPPPLAASAPVLLLLLLALSPHRPSFTGKARGEEREEGDRVKQQGQEGSEEERQAQQRSQEAEETQDQENEAGRMQTAVAEVRQISSLASYRVPRGKGLLQLPKQNKPAGQGGSLASAQEPRQQDSLPGQGEFLPGQQLQPIQMESSGHNPIVHEPAGNPVAEPLAEPTAEPASGGMGNREKRERSVCRSMSMESSVRRSQHQQGRKGSGAAASASLQAAPKEDVLVPSVHLQQKLQDYQEALQYHDQQHLHQHPNQQLHQQLTQHEHGHGHGHGQQLVHGPGHEHEHRETTSGTKHGSTGGGTAQAPIPKHRRHHTTAAAPPLAHGTAPDTTTAAGYPRRAPAAALVPPVIDVSAAASHVGMGAAGDAGGVIDGSSPPSASLKANAGMHGIRVWHLGAPAAALVPPVIDVSSVAAAAHVGLGQSGDAGGVIELDKTRMFVVGAGLFSGLTVALYPLSVIKTRLQVSPLPLSAAHAAPASAPPSAPAPASAGAGAPAASARPAAHAAANAGLAGAGGAAGSGGTGLSRAVEAGGAEARAGVNGAGATTATTRPGGEARVAAGATPVAQGAPGATASGTAAAVGGRSAGGGASAAAGETGGAGGGVGAGGAAARAAGGGRRPSSVTLAVGMARHIARTEGVRGFFRGMGTVVAGMLPGRIIYMAVLEAVKANTLKGINGAVVVPVDVVSGGERGWEGGRGGGVWRRERVCGSGVGGKGGEGEGCGEGVGEWGSGGVVVWDEGLISSRLVAQQGDLPPHHTTRPTPAAPGVPLSASTPAAAAGAARAGAAAAGGGAGAAAVRYKRGIDALVTILRTEGPRGLYRGFGLSVLTYAPSGFIWWGTYGATQRLFWSSYDRLWAPAGNTAAPPLPLVVGVQVGGGMCAGLASALATTPLDTVKTRIQVGRRSGAAVTVAVVVRQLVEQDGVRGLYRGFAPRCASTMLWGTAMVSTYEYLST